MKKILLLGGSAQQVVAIQTAKKLGLYTILCDYLLDNPGQYIADKFYHASTTDMDAILEIAGREKVDGILAYASDPAAPTAAYVAEQLGMPGNPFESVEILCNKDRFRTFLRENGFNSPNARGYISKEEAVSDLSAGMFQFPVIVKPVDSSGSKGVTILQKSTDTGMIWEAIDSAFCFSRGKRIVVEEYIVKKHPYLIGGDIFVVDGRIVIWGLMNCHRDNAVNSLVPVGKSYPLCLADADLQAVKETLQKMVTSLGIKNGPMNVELIVDCKNRVFPIDIGPRSGGNMIPDLLGDIFHIDIAQMSINAAMGNAIGVQSVLLNEYYATHNLHSSKDGIYKGVQISKKLEPYIYRKIFYKKRGDDVNFFDNASKCLGIIFMRFQNENEMESIINNINEFITIELD